MIGTLCPKSIKNIYYLLKLSNKKHKLYDKFLKNKTYTNEKIYKSYKNLFETIKFKSKKIYYTKLISKYQNNLKKHGV